MRYLVIGMAILSLCGCARRVDLSFWNGYKYFVLVKNSKVTLPVFEKLTRVFEDSGMEQVSATEKEGVPRSQAAYALIVTYTYDTPLIRASLCVYIHDASTGTLLKESKHPASFSVSRTGGEEGALDTCVGEFNLWWSDRHRYFDPALGLTRPGVQALKR